MPEFAPLPDDEVATVLAKRGATRLRYFLTAVTASGTLCTWGDDEDISFMQDEDGVIGLPVWPHPVFAEREFRDHAQPGEGPIPIELDRFLEVWLPQLEKDGDGISVFPVQNRIAVTLTPAELRSKIAAARQQSPLGLDTEPTD